MVRTDWVEDYRDMIAEDVNFVLEQREDARAQGFDRGWYRALDAVCDLGLFREGVDSELWDQLEALRSKKFSEL